jgi:Outer membrane protein beta-barrel domain
MDKGLRPQHGPELQVPAINLKGREIHMRNTLHSSIMKSAFFLGTLLATAQLASAQAMIAAGRGTEIAPFVQTTLVRPDWGPTSNIGYTVGVDYTRFIRSIVQPSIEVRMTSANGKTVNERSYAGGLKLQTAVHGIHPYATFLVGYGTITLNYPEGTYTGDDSVIYSYGGGADFKVTSAWKLRLDFSQQNWNLGTNASLTPMTFGVGVSYSLPFHNGRVR